jgi:UDP-N-acetyl-D-glucosamine dehydrogenase
VAQVLEDGKTLTSVSLTEEALGGADAVVILTDHSVFDYEWIVDHSRVLIDARHAVPRAGREVGTGWVVKS